MALRDCGVAICEVTRSEKQLRPSQSHVNGNILFLLAIFFTGQFCTEVNFEAAFKGCLFVVQLT